MYIVQTGKMNLLHEWSRFPPTGQRLFLRPSERSPPSYLVNCQNEWFTNVALPDEFEKLLSTMRSREISVSIILQNLAQLKALFE